MDTRDSSLVSERWMSRSARAHPLYTRSFCGEGSANR